MSDQLMREQFEQWWARSEKLTQDWEIEKAFWRVQPLNNYRWPRVYDAWESWKASRAAVVVELPNTECFGEYSQEAASVMRDGCADAIEEQGLNYKVLP
jgi:hypothetical protein